MANGERRVHGVLVWVERESLGRRQPASAARSLHSPTLALTAVWFAAATGCAGAKPERPVQEPSGARSQERPAQAQYGAPSEVTVDVLTKDDLMRRMPSISDAEAASVVAVSFPETLGCPDGPTARVKSSVRGSFTGPGLHQSMYYVVVSKCGGLPSEHTDYTVVFQSGREVYRDTGAEPVRAMDVDGDGQDEWLELHGRCDDMCATEAWVYGHSGGKSKLFVHVERAQESDCQTMADGVHGQIKQVSVSLVRQRGKLLEMRSERVEACK